MKKNTTTFKIEQKGENFIVSNSTTGVVRGVHKKKDEAQQQMRHLEKTHAEGISMVSAKITKPAPIASDE